MLVWEPPSPSPSSNEGSAAQCRLFLSWRRVCVGGWSGRVQLLVTAHYSIMVGAYWMLVGDVGWAMGSPRGEVGGAEPAPSAVWGVVSHTVGRRRAARESGVRWTGVLRYIYCNLSHRIRVICRRVYAACYARHPTVTCYAARGTPRRSPRTRHGATAPGAAPRRRHVCIAMWHCGSSGKICGAADASRSGLACDGRPHAMQRPARRARAARRFFRFSRGIIYL